MKSTICPDQESLRQLLLGSMIGPAAEQLEEHLLHCDACSAAADAISADDELTAALRYPDVAHGDEELLPEAIERAKQLRSQAETVETDETLVTKSLSRVEDSDDSTGIAIIDEPIDFLAPGEQSDEIGRLGEYRVLEVLGVGGMGIVFLAEDPKLERQVALKAMKPAVAASHSAKDRFFREAKATAAIEHDNIVHIYQVGEDRGLPFIAMQFLRGESLETRLKRERRLDQREVLRIGREVAAGLEAAHQRGLIHRDIKPDNIWLEGGTGRVKIVDFGLVRTVTDDASLTQVGVVLGTPRYMAPEQALGEQVDHRCDLFSLGSVLYHLATGKAPFEGDNVTANLIAVVQKDPQPAGMVCSEIDPDLSSLIMRLLCKERTGRPQSAAEVAESLGEIESKLAAEKAEQPHRQDSAETLRLSLSESAQTPNSHTFRSKEGRTTSVAPRLFGGALVTIALAVFAWLYFAGVFFKVETKNGTLIVKVVGDDIVTSIQGERITIKNTDTDETFTIALNSPQEKQSLKPGPYQFLLTTDSGLVATLDRFTIRSGQDEVVEVRFEPKATQTASQRLDDQGLARKSVAGGNAADSREEVASLSAGSIWIGKRTYRKGMYAGKTVAYELHVRQRDGDKFIGHVFDNGPSRNRAEVEGEAAGGVLSWTEKSRGNVVNVKARLSGEMIDLTFSGNYANGAANQGDGELAKSTVLVRGKWRIDGDVIEQTETGRSAMLLFGLPEFGDGDFTCEAMRSEGDHGLALVARAADLENYYYFDIGVFKNKYHSIYSKEAGTNWRLIDQRRAPPVPTDRWVKMRLRLRGESFEGYLDDQLVVSGRDKRRLNGYLGLRTWNEAGKYRNLRFTDPFGKVLWQGLPELPAPASDDRTSTGTNDRRDAAEPDRRAAEWVLSVGGNIKVNEQDEFADGARLPTDNPFRLTYVGLGDNVQVSDSDMAVFKGCVHLAALELENTKVSDESVKIIGGLKKLQVVDLTKTRVTNSGIEELQRTLPDCKIIWDGGVIEPQGTASPTSDKTSSDKTSSDKTSSDKTSSDRSSSDRSSSVACDYDTLATGQWIPVLTGSGETVKLRNATIRDGVIEIQNGHAFDKSILASDAIVRAKVQKLHGQSVLITLRDVLGVYYCAVYEYDDGERFGVGTRDARFRYSVKRHFASSVDAAAGEIFEMAFSAVGDVLTVYANGRRVGQLRDISITRPGGVAVHATRGKGVFKDVEVMVLRDPAH